jgi:hypothetical protein
MAQWIRRLTTNQEIPGSTPGSLNFWLLSSSVVYVAQLLLFCYEAKSKTALYTPLIFDNIIARFEYKWWPIYLLGKLNIYFNLISLHHMSRDFIRRNTVAIHFDLDILKIKICRNWSNNKPELGDIFYTQDYKRAQLFFL